MDLDNIFLASFGIALIFSDSTFINKFSELVDNPTKVVS